MDGLFFLPCELICSSASLWDKYSYMNASVIWQPTDPAATAAVEKPASSLHCQARDEFVGGGPADQERTSPRPPPKAPACVITPQK